MKRDPELIRKILLRVEELPVKKTLSQGSLAIDDYDPDIISEHVRLLQEADYIDARIAKTQGITIPSYVIFRLLNDGHDFLDAIRNETVWEKVKETIKKQGGNIPVPIIAGLAQKYLAAHLGL